MLKWNKLIAKSLYVADKRIDKISYGLNRRFSNSAIAVLPYLSYGTDTKVFLKGRVLKARAMQEAQDGDSAWENLKNAYKRFASQEIPNAHLELHVRNKSLELQTDEEGYFEAWLDFEDTSLNASSELFLEYSVDLINPKPKKQIIDTFEGMVIVPSKEAEFGIISDMDDTVLKSDATRVLGMLKKVLFENAKTRLPFDGVAEFYQALHKDGKNPLFYVSSSPWNLYDLLIEFLDDNDIPVGPLLLRDWGTSPTEFLPTSHSSHKVDAITDILETYPDLKFILIGDSGQEDPEIYKEIGNKYPERIKAVYIRDVSENAQRDKKILALSDELERAGSGLLLLKDTRDALVHAKLEGWI